MMKKIFTAACLVMIFFAATAQEVEFPLSGNPVLKEYWRKNPVKYHVPANHVQSSLALPFEDDFSRPGIFPRPDLWVDSDAFINQTFCDNPISIGVATLDGINKYGQPHDSMSQSPLSFLCDYLTSQPIDLSGLSGADSVYLGFFYQPQGLGDEPEEGDTLGLQFYGSDGVDSGWTNIWYTLGRPDSAFQEVRIKIDSSAFLWEGFQFRFYNYGNPNSNRDHWNLDYVTLRKNDNAVDTIYDITLIKPIQSYLQDFTAMPYSHYKEEIINGHNPVKTEITDTVRVYELLDSISYSIKFTVTDRFGTNIFTGSVTNLDANNNTDNTDYFHTVSLPNALFPNTLEDFTDFTIKHYLSPTGDVTGPKGDDTSEAVQHFYNYYAYDDGSAESATGVHVAYTKYAYQFDVKKSDSLIGISIYFNPWGINVHNDLFSLCMWDNISPGGTNDVLVHQTIDQKPANNDSINGFVDYYLDYPVAVSKGIHYFGIIQSSANEIGIGVDHNTDSHMKMFVNYNNYWYQSTITGSWMMRPLFGKRNTIGINEIPELNFDVYPNPANTKVFVETSGSGKANAIHIYNMIGEEMISQTIPTAQTKTILDISSLSPGVYFVQLSNGNDLLTGTKKLIVTAR